MAVLPRLADFVLVVLTVVSNQPLQRATSNSRQLIIPVQLLRLVKRLLHVLNDCVGNA